jgi:hypothetical protein
MNITQQVAASIGTALFSVLLTNGFNSSDAVTRLRSAVDTGGHVDPRILPAAFSDMSSAFATVFLVATVLVALCLVPAFLLPRRKPAQTMEPTAAMMH